MMPTAEGMTHMMPNHVLRVGQSIHLEQTHDAVSPHPCGDQGDHDLDISLDNLNRLILELDPTFEPIQVNQSSPCTGTPTGTLWPESQLLLFRSPLCHTFCDLPVCFTELKHTDKVPLRTTEHSFLTKE